MKEKKLKRIVLIGAGPTTLGALYRLYDLGVLRSNQIQVIVVEKEREAGGLASSFRDSEGFLWDNGGHVVFSHYKYFDTALDKAIADWNERKRASFAFMNGADNIRRFIPYPVQNSIHFMDEKFQNISLRGLEEAVKRNANNTKKIRNFDDWLLRNFGTGLCEIFMRKYNKKVWTVNSTEMNSIWVGERVAVPDINTIKSNIAAAKANKLEDAAWGPNRLFRFPKYGGTGGVWKGVASKLPQGWFHYRSKVVRVDLDNKQIKVDMNGLNSYNLHYDILISTAPLDLLVKMISDESGKAMLMDELTSQLIYSHTHVIGIGLTGKPPSFLQDKSWIYFPDSDSPFYRATVFSSYADDNVPDGDTHKYWSLMCEAAEPKVNKKKSYWNKENLVKETVRALVDYGYINESQVVSRYYYRLDHGYPIPSIKRDEILAQVQPWLESHSIYSRGRFGGWRYEVGNQDHSFMQGVEVADLIMLGVPEQTYPNAALVNSMKAMHRALNNNSSRAMDFEYVVSCSNSDDESWLLPYADHTHIYYQGLHVLPDFRFRMWNNIADVGQESYSYLYHIVQNYDTLADITVFLRGDHPNSQFCYSDDLHEYVIEGKQKGLAFKKLETFNNWKKLNIEEHSVTKSHDTFEKYWQAHLQSPHPDSTFWNEKACFSVSRKLILQRPKSFYDGLISSVNKRPNPMEAHYLRRMWWAIFSQ